jgi:fimbrial chaperone protein
MKIGSLAIAPCLFFSIVPGAAQAQGYQVQPMLATIAPSGSDSHLTMSIKNTGAVTITLELIPFRATVDDNGTPKRIDEEADVLVYPAQSAIEPGKEQAVQIRYIGEPALTEARMYGVRVSQLPVSAPGYTGTANAGSTASDVKVSFNFLSHIIVSPVAVKAAIQETAREPNGDLVLRITNSGNGIAVLNASEFTLTDSTGKTMTLAADDLHFGDFSAFMPNQTRRATVSAKKLAGLVGMITPKLTVQ